MTWLFICVVFHSILSVDYRNTPILKRIQGCWEIQSLCGDSGGDRQLRVEKCAATGPALAAWLPPSAQAHGKLGNASNSLLPGQMQLVLLEAGQGEQWWCAQFTAFLHTDTGTKWQGRAPEHLEADSCGHYPLGFNCCLELMNHWLARHLWSWHGSKEFINGSRCVAAPWLVATTEKFYGSNETLSGTFLSSLPRSLLLCQWHLLPVCITVLSSFFFFFRKDICHQLHLSAGSQMPNGSWRCWLVLWHRSSFLCSIF